MNTKICNKCGRELPLNADYFLKRKDSKDGFRNDCKECHSNSHKKYYAENAEKVKNKVNQYRKNNFEYIRVKKKKYYNQHIEEIKEYQQKYREQHGEKAKEYKKEYYKNNIEYIRQWKREYRENHKEELQKKKHNYYLKNKGKVKEYIKSWIQNGGSEYRKIQNQHRKALKRNLPSDFTKQDWENCKTYFNNKCCYCDKEAELQQEHFIALTKDGEYTANNILPACSKCNISKRNKDFFEWYPKYKYYSKKREAKILKYLNYDKNKIQQLALII